MAKPRAETVYPSEVQVFHVFNRCVRRTFLCGYDKLSGRDYSHRKQWLRERMEFLVGIFAFDIATFCIMSNHFHLVARSRPDIVDRWSDREVIVRNLRLQGTRWFRKDGTERSSTQAEIERIASDPDEVLRLRRKLSNLSDLMAYFDEHSAKRANREDNVKGAFWEGTYGVELLEDEEAILACMAYVDLNPVRAEVASSIEESEFTGAYERLTDLRQHQTLGGNDDSETLAPEANQTRSTDEEAEPHSFDGFHWGGSQPTLKWERNGGKVSGWLAPIELGKDADFLDLDESGRRPSRKGFLPMSMLRYMEVVDWAGRVIREDKRGSIPPESPPIFDRLGFCSQGFLERMLQFNRQRHYFEATERKGIPDANFHALRV